MTESILEIEGQKFFVRDNTNDADVVRSCRMEYALPSMEGYEPGSFILDIGSHIGGFSLWAAQKYMDCRVIAVEPLPENQTLFMRNVEMNNLQGRITLIRAAAWSKKEPTLIIPYGDPATESGRIHYFIGNAAARPEGSINQAVARTISLKEIVSGIPKVWCLKSDCEGGEDYLFPDAEPSDLLRLKWVVAEFHNGREKLDTLFRSSGFTVHSTPGYHSNLLYENSIPFSKL